MATEGRSPPVPSSRWQNRRFLAWSLVASILLLSIFNIVYQHRIIHQVKQVDILQVERWALADQANPGLWEVLEKLGPVLPADGMYYYASTPDPRAWDEHVTPHDDDYAAAGLAGPGDSASAHDGESLAMLGGKTDGEGTLAPPGGANATPAAAQGGEEPQQAVQAKTNIPIVQETQAPVVPGNIGAGAKADKVAAAPVPNLVKKVYEKDHSAILKNALVERACHQLSLGKCLGGGTFGFVFEGACTRCQEGGELAAACVVEKVAVKYPKWWLKDKDKHQYWMQGRNRWEKELEMMALIRKKGAPRNIAALLGVANTTLSKIVEKDKSGSCVNSVAASTLLEANGGEIAIPGMVIEKSPIGSIHKFLGRKKYRQKYKEVSNAMLDVFIGVAKGHQFLHSLDIVHKDLDVIGKNILVKKDEKGPTAMFIDFGVSVRCNKEKDYKGVGGKAIEMYEFGNMIYKGCFGVDVYPTGGNATHNTFRCSASQSETGLTKIRKAHQGNHKPFFDAKAKAQCRELESYKEIMELLWSPVVNSATDVGKLQSTTWEDIIAKLESIKKKQPKFFTTTY
eukprot:Rmarinus@m.3659